LHHLSMNSKVVLGIELGLIGIYLALVLLVFDTSKVLGLIEVGVLTLIIFPLVLVLEKQREKGKSMDTEIPAEATSEIPVQQPSAASSPASSLPSQPPSSSFSPPPSR